MTQRYCAGRAPAGQSLPDSDAQLLTRLMAKVIANQALRQAAAEQSKCKQVEPDEAGSGRHEA